MSNVIIRPNQPPPIRVSGGNPSSPVVTVPSSEITVTVPSGQPGATGPTGPAGPQGPATAASYVHHQAVPSASWVITHPLEYYPAVTIVDSAGEEVEGDLVYNSASTLTVTFSGAFSGTAYLS